MFLLREFLTEESGAATVDWVVLTAALCTLGFYVALSVSNGIENSATDISTAMADEDRYDDHFGGLELN